MKNTEKTEKSGYKLTDLSEKISFCAELQDSKYGEGIEYALGLSLNPDKLDEYMEKYNLRSGDPLIVIIKRDGGKIAMEINEGNGNYKAWSLDNQKPNFALFYNLPE